MSYLGESARHVGAFDHVNIGNAAFSSVTSSYLSVEGSADIQGDFKIGGALDVTSLDVVNGVTASNVTVTGPISSQTATVLGNFNASSIVTQSVVATTSLHTNDLIATGAVHLGNALTVSGALHLLLPQVDTTENDTVKQVLYDPDTGKVTFGSVSEVSMPDNAAFNEMNSTTSSIATLSCNNAEIQSLQGAVANVTTITSDSLNTAALTTPSGNIQALTSQTGTVGQLFSTTGSIASLSSTTGNVQTLTSNEATITTLNATTASANEMSATHGTVTNMSSTNTTSNSITASSSLVSNGTLTARNNVLMPGIGEQITLSTLYYNTTTGRVTFGDSPVVTGGGGGNSLNPIGDADLTTLKVSGNSTFGTSATPASITAYGDVKLNGLAENLDTHVLYYDQSTGNVTFGQPVTGSVNDTELVPDGVPLNTLIRVSVVSGSAHELPDAVTIGTIKTIINGNESAYKPLGSNNQDFHFANHRAYFEQRFQRLVKDSAGNLYTIGILFNQYGGANATVGTGVSVVLKYTRATDSWAIMREDGKTGYFNGTIADIGVDSQGNVYACGAFRYINKTYDLTTTAGFLNNDILNGERVDFIARWDAASSKWAPIKVQSIAGIAMFGSDQFVTEAYFTVDCLYIDLMDNAWFGTRSNAPVSGTTPWGKYLCRYTHGNEFFESFYTNFGDTLSLAGNQGVYSIALDEEIVEGVGQVINKVYIYCHSSLGRALILCGTPVETIIDLNPTLAIPSWSVCGASSTMRPIEVGTTLTFKHMYSLSFYNGLLYCASFNRYVSPLDMSDVKFGNYQALVYDPATDDWSSIGRGVTGAPQSSSEQLEIAGTMYPYPTFRTPRIFSLAMDGTKIYAVGLFTRAIQTDGTSISANNVAMWDQEAGVWRSLGVGLKLYDSTVTTAVTQVGSSIYFAGMFYETGDSSTMLNQVAELQIDKLCRITGKFSSNDTPQDEIVLSIAQEQVSVMWNGARWLIVKQ